MADYTKDILNILTEEIYFKLAQNYKLFHTKFCLPECEPGSCHIYIDSKQEPYPQFDIHFGTTISIRLRVGITYATTRHFEFTNALNTVDTVLFEGSIHDPEMIDMLVNQVVKLTHEYWEVFPATKGLGRI